MFQININLTNTDIMTTIEIIVVVATGMYEVLSRVVPTSKTWSIIGTILNALKFISDKLDNKK